MCGVCSCLVDGVNVDGVSLFEFVLSLSTWSRFSFLIWAFGSAAVHTIFKYFSEETLARDEMLILTDHSSSSWRCVHGFAADTTHWSLFIAQRWPKRRIATSIDHPSLHHPRLYAPVETGFQPQLWNLLPPMHTPNSKDPPALSRRTNSRRGSNSNPGYLTCSL